MTDESGGASRVAPRPRVVVTRRLPKAVEATLAELFDVALNRDDRALEARALAAAMREADALLPTVSDRIGAELFAVADRRVRIVANYGVGVNHIDLDAARTHGVAVTNTPEVLTDDTADLALTLLLMVARRAGEGERHLRAGEWTGWRPTHLLGTRVRGKTLGVVGLGRIGRTVAERARQAFGMRVLFYDPSHVGDAPSEARGAERCGSIEALLEGSDFVTLHCPATPATHHLIDRPRLELMKPTAFLINTARGDVVDESALVEALRSRTIAGAGLDVYEHEPAVAPELLRMENVVLLPHLGSATLETRVAMGERAIENLVAFFAGREPRDRVA